MKGFQYLKVAYRMLVSDIGLFQKKSKHGGEGLRPYFSEPLPLPPPQGRPKLFNIEWAKSNKGTIS